MYVSCLVIFFLFYGLKPKRLGMLTFFLSHILGKHLGNIFGKFHEHACWTAPGPHKGFQVWCKLCISISKGGAKHIFVSLNFPSSGKGRQTPLLAFGSVYVHRRRIKWVGTGIGRIYILGLLEELSKGTFDPYYCIFPIVYLLYIYFYEFLSLS